MDKTLWRNACEEFLEIADLPVDQRGSYLGCLEPALRRGVESLLTADAEAERFLEEPACPRHVTESLKAAARAAPELRLGPYHLERELSVSRMSRVFLARRDDGEYEKEVAVKVISYEAASDELLERFRQERQILATLDHPNIARLLDGGTTDDGLPYLVMEYVEGTPIDQYCDARRLSVRQRIELVLEVCSAVEYAHDRGVVHRDLKATNILVTRSGTPKLIDFGIAKIQQPTGRAGEETSPGTRPMTPYYASPEQIAGGAITPATDIYSMGVLLFKLLVGRFPYRFAERSAEVVRKAVLHQPASGLVTALLDDEVSESEPVVSVEGRSRDRGTTPAALRRAVAGELQDIVRMTLEKEPGRRYRRVSDLADDLGRHLGGRPVAAKGTNVFYRSRKFVSRNWQRIGIAVLLAWAVIALGGFSIRSQQLAEERDRLASQREEAEEVVAFLESIFQLPRGQRGRGATIKANQLLDLSARRVVRRVDHDPEVKQRLLNSIGGMYADLGLHQEADQFMRAAGWRLTSVDEAAAPAGGEHRPSSRPPSFPSSVEPVGTSTAPYLTVSGSCPGQLEVKVEGATPGGSVVIAGSRSLGEDLMEKGPCKGTTVGVADKRIAAFTVADAGGTAIMKRWTPKGQCRAYLQPVDYTTCKAGGVVQVVLEGAE